MTSIVVVSGGLREPSSTRLLADRLSAAVVAELSVIGEREAGEATATTIELRPLGRAVMDAMLTGFANEQLEEAFALLRNADALVAVTPSFNASFGGLFKSFFDVLPEETLSGMPVLIGATGGTERHSLVLEHALRPMFSYLEAIVSPTGVYAATEDFGNVDAEEALSRRVARAASDFARLIRSCGTRTPRDAWAEELLAMQALLGTTEPRRDGDD